MRPTIDRSAYPIVILEFPTELTTDDVIAHFDDIAQIVARAREPIAVVADISRCSPFDPVLRKIGAARMRAVFHRYGDKVAGVAHVTSSVLIRGAMTAVYWMAPPPFPVTTTRERAEAERWARSLL